MSLTGTVSLNVPALPDNDTAFVNNAAWQAYWSNVELLVEFDPSVNNLYVESVYNSLLPYVTIGADIMPSQAQFQSLLLAYQTLNINYKNLLTVLKNAGLITNAT